MIVRGNFLYVLDRDNSCEKLTGQRKSVFIRKESKQGLSIC